jgi:hypothetical protein
VTQTQPPLPLNLHDGASSSQVGISQPQIGRKVLLALGRVHALTSTRLTISARTWKERCRTAGAGRSPPPPPPSPRTYRVAVGVKPAGIRW